MTATIIGDEKTNEETPPRLSSLSAAGNDHDRRLGSTLLDCPTPANANHEVTFTVRTLIDPVRQCTQTELIGMRNLIDYHFNQLLQVTMMFWEPLILLQSDCRALSLEVVAFYLHARPRQQLQQQ